VIGAGKRDVAEDLYAIGLAEDRADLSKKRKRSLAVPPSVVVIKAVIGDEPKANGAIGLAEHVADLLVERQRRLVTLARALTIGAGKSDFAEAKNATGLGEKVADIVKSIHDDG
jgi:hypothetical protein